MLPTKGGMMEADMIGKFSAYMGTNKQKILDSMEYCVYGGIGYAKAGGGR